MLLENINQLTLKEMQAVNHTIREGLSSSVSKVHLVAEHLINSGGKRIRPLVTLLSGLACDANLEHLIKMATVIEFIHTATLLHDDVVDVSSTRRGKPTANKVWDNASAILVGDFLYSRAFQMMVSVNDMQAMQILANATNLIAEGEVLQLQYQHQPCITKEQYLEVIERKTAILFGAASELGAVMANQDTDIQHSLKAYGLHLGRAFQLIDDVLDYQATDSDWGKTIGNDLAQGRATLPIIYALEHTNHAQKSAIRHAITVGDTDSFESIQTAIVSSGAIDYTMQIAKQEVDKAKHCLTHLASSVYQNALNDLAEFALIRKK